MNSQQPPSHGAAPGESDRPEPIHEQPDIVPEPTHEAAFGSRLRAAREARGLDVETCAHALKLPARVLRQLEAGRFDGLDHKIYLGSYIAKYGRHLGLDEAAIQEQVAQVRGQREPSLVATGGISHSRYLLERYATAATYLVLTAVIVVPVVWLGVRGTLNRDIGHLAPLDAAPVAQQEFPASSRSIAATPPRAAAPATAGREDDEQPLLASMVPNITPELARPVAPALSADATVGQGGHVLELTLADASWVEVTGTDGSRIEYGLLPAGTHKSYRSDQPLEVRLGNANGAQVSLDGQPVSLDAYRRANVAHFRVQMDDGKASPHGV